MANLDETKRKFTNPQCGRVYYAKGISPTLNTCGGGRQTTQVFSDMQTKVTTPPKSRYVLGRSNHDPDGSYDTSRFHVNPYFNTVTAIQMSNRRQWIVEIK